HCDIGSEYIQTLCHGHISTCNARVACRGSVPFSGSDHGGEVSDGCCCSALDGSDCPHRHSHCSDRQSVRAAARMEPVVEVHEQRPFAHYEMECDVGEDYA